MKAYKIFMALLTILVFGGAANAEERFCGGGLSCRENLENKVQLSYLKAAIGVIGSFKKADDSELQYFKDDIARAKVIFSVDQNLKGSEDCAELKFKVPVYIRDKSGNGSTMRLIVVKNYPEVAKKLDNLEIEIEENDFKKEDYLQKLKRNRDSLDVEGTSLSQSAFLLHVSPPGWDDYSYRIADVPIKFDQKYILFLLVEPSEDRPLHSWGLDIYPVDGRVDLKDILNPGKKISIVRKSKDIKWITLNRLPN